MTQSSFFFFKDFESNYNSLSLIKLVPPHHSVMFFLAASQLEELLVFVSSPKGCTILPDSSRTDGSSALVLPY